MLFSQPPLSKVAMKSVKVTKR